MVAVTAADSMPSLIGYVLNRTYKLVQLLGAGTYGVVYKALDIRTARSEFPIYRAIKVIRKAGRKKSEIEGIRREINLHNAVSKHRGIVRLYDAFDDDDYFYIILDYCEGGDLFEQICEKRVYEGNPELARIAFISLIDAVQACHSNRIAHRDLKPENVLTSQDGSELYLADFGLATTKRVIAEFGCGTGVYMSPGTSSTPFSYRQLYHSFALLYRMHWRAL